MMRAAVETGVDIGGPFAAGQGAVRNGAGEYVSGGPGDKLVPPMNSVAQPLARRWLAS